MMWHLRAWLLITLFFGTGVVAGFAGGAEEEPPPPRLRLATVVTETASSVPYAEVVAGVRRAVDEHERIALTEYVVSSAGELAERVNALTNAGQTDIIVTAGQEGARAAVNAPDGDTRFLVFDAVVVGDPRVRSVGVNHREAAFLAGHAVGLVFEDTGDGARTAAAGGDGAAPGGDGARATIVVADTGALIEEVIRPAFALGVHSLAPAVDIDLMYLRPDFSDDALRRIVGQKQTDAFLVLADGGMETLATAVGNHVAHASWMNRYSADRPDAGMVTRSGVDLEAIAYRRATAAIADSLPFGEAEVIALSNEALSFEIDERQLPGPDRSARAQRLREMQRRIETGDVELLMPERVILERTSTP